MTDKKQSVTCDRCGKTWPNGVSDSYVHTCSPKQSADELQDWAVTECIALIQDDIRPDGIIEFAEEYHKRKQAEQPQATHKISACYFPGHGIAELTWEDIASGEMADLLVNVSKEKGKAISKVVMPCVYQDAVAEQPSFEARCADVLRGILEEAQVGWRVKPTVNDKSFAVYELVRAKLEQLESEASDEHS
jgi:hypothetical protein